MSVPDGAWLVCRTGEDRPIGRAIIQPDGFNGFMAYREPPGLPPVSIGFSDDLDGCVETIIEYEEARLGGEQVIL